MAKITTLKFNIASEDFQVHINCNSSGVFSANIPEIVAKAFNLESKISKSKLSEVETAINEAVARYKTAQTQQELFIAIKYQAREYYSQRADFGVLFGSHGNDYNLERGFGSSIDALGFEFKICIKETVDGSENWFSTRQGKDFFSSSIESASPEKYFKSSKLSSSDFKTWKKITYSETALITLQNARETIRKASEMLFNFIEQDEETILLQLTNQKLLS